MELCRADEDTDTLSCRIADGVRDACAPMMPHELFVYYRCTVRAAMQALLKRCERVESLPAGARRDAREGTLLADAGVLCKRAHRLMMEALAAKGQVLVRTLSDLTEGDEEHPGPG